MSRSNIFKMLMIETLENSLSSGIPSTFIISWVSVTAFRQVWYSRVAAWQHFHTGVFDLKAVILAQPRLVRSRNSCKTSTCQTSLYVLPERCVISLMLANMIPEWRQLVLLWCEGNVLYVMLLKVCKIPVFIWMFRFYTFWLIKFIFKIWMIFFWGGGFLSVFLGILLSLLCSCENILIYTYACSTWMQVCVPEQLHLCALIATPSANTHHLRVEQHTYSWGSKTNNVPQ